MGGNGVMNINQDDVKKALNTLNSFPIFGGDEQTDPSDVLVKMLALPDNEFDVLAPGVLESFQRSVNNPNDRIALTQMINAMGLKSDDLIESFIAIQDELDAKDFGFSASKKDFLKQFLGVIVNAVNETEGISKRMLVTPIELCNENAKIPQYAHVTDSGADVYALDDITIHPGETVVVPTGIKLATPPGYEVQVRAKSGRAMRTKLRLCNAIGTVDEGYRDEIMVLIENIEPRIKDITINDEGKVTSILYGSDYYIGKGEKFCQLVLAEVPKMAFVKVDNVSDIGDNRNGGLGSTGLK